MKNKMPQTDKVIAEIIPAVKLPSEMTQFFSYRIPEGLRKTIRIGSVVTIPFRNKEILGMVRSLTGEQETTFKLKDVKETVDALAFSAQQMEFADYISGYYLTPLSLVIKIMLPEITKQASRTEIGLNPSLEIGDIDADIKNKALREIKKQDRTLLIHSLLSERHELYREIIGLGEEDSQALLMFPEYFDLFQSAQYYINAFGKERVAILTSDITKNQYYSEWQKVKSGGAKIVISTRQGVFAPFTKLGTIIVDDEHNSSYKQWDQNPRYHGVQAATFLAKLHRAKIILSSPTPTLESYYRTQDDFAKTDISSKTENSVTVIDFDTERKMGNRSFLGERVKEALLEKIYKKKQALIFIPRLGEKTMHQCKDCGHIAECAVCQGALIGYKGKLYCPRCKQVYENLADCPKCHGQNINAFGGGSQRVFDELVALFENKNINIVQLDSSTSEDGNRNQKIFADFLAGKIDILVGTQMIWKNWAMPNLGLVAVIFPEIIFNSPGFRSKEKSWQFLSRIYGYAGGRDVFIETYKPEHKYYAQFRSESVEKFLDTELETRRVSLSHIQYPPLGKLIKLIYKDADARACEKEAKWQYEKLGRKIFDENLKEAFEVMPPFPAQSYREYGKYRWHIIIRHRTDASRETRDQLLSSTIKNWIVDIDPDEIL